MSASRSPLPSPSFTHEGSAITVSALRIFMVTHASIAYNEGDAHVRHSMLLAKGADPVSDFTQIVAGSPWEEMVLDLVLQPAVPPVHLHTQPPHPHPTMNRVPLSPFLTHYLEPFSHILLSANPLTRIFHMCGPFQSQRVSL